MNAPKKIFLQFLIIPALSAVEAFNKRHDVFLFRFAKLQFVEWQRLIFNCQTQTGSAAFIIKVNHLLQAGCKPRYAYRERCARHYVPSAF